MTSRKRQSKSWPSSKKRTPRSGSTKKELRIRKVALAKVKDDLSKHLHLAAVEEIVITRHGRPAGVLIGFESEDDWFDYRLENDPRFLRRIEQARDSLRAGRGIQLEHLAEQEDIPKKEAGDNLADRIRRRVAKFGGVDLEVPPRGPIADPRIARRPAPRTGSRKPKRG